MTQLTHGVQKCQALPGWWKVNRFNCSNSEQERYGKQQDNHSQGQVPAGSVRSVPCHLCNHATKEYAVKRENELKVVPGVGEGGAQEIERHTGKKQGRCDAQFPAPVQWQRKTRNEYQGRLKGICPNQCQGSAEQSVWNRRSLDILK